MTPCITIGSGPTLYLQPLKQFNLAEGQKPNMHPTKLKQMWSGAWFWANFPIIPKPELRQSSGDSLTVHHHLQWPVIICPASWGFGPILLHQDVVTKRSLSEMYINIPPNLKEIIPTIDGWNPAPPKIYRSTAGKNGINYQIQMLSHFFEPSTVSQPPFFRANVRFNQCISTGKLDFWTINSSPRSERLLK